MTEQSPITKGDINKRFLEFIDDKERTSILTHIANHYGVSVSAIMVEVTAPEAEDLLDYMVEPVRSATYFLMLRHRFR